MCFCRDVGGVQCQFAIALVSMAVADVDATSVNLDRADEHSSSAYFIGIKMRIGLCAVERFQRHAIWMACPNQEIAKVSGIMRIRQIDARRGANVADKWTESRKRAGDSMWLKEENGVLACIWWQCGYLFCTLRKVVSSAFVYR